MRERHISCSALRTAKDWTEVLAMPRADVSVDWWGRALEQPFRYAIGRDGQHLVYVGEVPRKASDLRRHEHGTFVADLAEPETGADTAELFVMHMDGRYCEIHVSPDGAWWYMDFAGYRQRLPGRVPAGVEVRIEHSEGSWVGAIRVPLRELPFAFDSTVRVQATAALCSGDEPIYVTSAGSPDFEPDFHNERCFAKCLVGL